MAPTLDFSTGAILCFFLVILLDLQYFDQLRLDVRVCNLKKTELENVFSEAMGVPRSSFQK